MRTRTFRGGVHPPYQKELTAAKPVVELSAPPEVVIPLAQHIGAPCKPLVTKGDRVVIGQKIGEAEAFVSAPVHASVSGEVIAVEPRPHPTGKKVMSVVIANDGENQAMEFEGHQASALSPKEILDLIREAGIVGLGGAAFPTHVKLSPPKDKPIDTLIINGCECEPYLTADHRLMVENAGDVVEGAFLAMTVLGVKRAVIGVEENKPDAIAALNSIAGARGIEVLPLETKYPQGAEKQLINAAVGREVPTGGLPMDVGVVVVNVGTAAAIASAVRDGMPLVRRIVTVTGDAVAEPQNFMVPLGTPFSYVIEAAGGFREKPGKVVMGGPMMGLAQKSLDVPVVKGTSGILVLSKAQTKEIVAMPCIRCARCVDICPMFLVPSALATLAEAGRFDKAEEMGVMNCIECGGCTYSCPAKRNIVQWARLAKSEIAARRRQKNAG